MTRREIVIVAAEAGVDPRTLERAIRGEQPRSTAIREALREALERHGFEKEARDIAGGNE